MKTFFKFILAASGFCLMIQGASAETAIIVNPANPITEISMEDVNKIFLGKSDKYASGDKAVPIDSAEGNGARDSFYTTVVKKTPNQLNAYWAKVIFTGKGQPPKSVSSDEEVVELVADDANGIGYVDAASVNDSVKVILKF